MAFVVFSLPRSRSAWLSVLLGSPDRPIGHDIAPQSASFDDFMDRVGAGTCETGMMFAWPAIRASSPGVRFAVIRRDPADVVRSLEWFGLTGYGEEIALRDAQLDEIAAEPGTLSVRYEDLTDPWTCGALYQHCLRQTMPRAWWAALDPINIQVDMRRQLQALEDRKDEIAAFRIDAERAARNCRRA